MREDFGFVRHQARRQLRREQAEARLARIHRHRRARRADRLCLAVAMAAIVAVPGRALAAWILGS